MVRVPILGPLAAKL